MGQKIGSVFARRRGSLVLALLTCLGASLATGISGQTITEFPLADDRAGPADIATGPDGNLWFTEGCAGRIGRITTAGVVTEFPIPGGTGTSLGTGIAVGPDGNLWYTSLSNNQVGRITTAGVVTAFPSVAGQPQGIAAGPDGNLWYTTRLGIATMTTTGAFLTEYPIPAGSSGPGTLEIVAGPDGNLWFTAFGNNTVGRITTAGAFTEFPMPTAGAQPYRIAVGPDGALWFTEGGPVSQIGRITTSGSVTEFPVTGGGTLSFITSGPDGALWFTESGANQIGRITTAGVITEFPLPTPNVQPTGITTGPDGALWFTEHRSGCSTSPNYAAIGRLALAAAQPTPTPTVPAPTPTVTPPIGPGPASDIPMLSPQLLALFALALAGAAIFLIRRG